MIATNETLIRLERFADNLLEMAKLDLRASEILYGNKLYPQAIFLAEQSSEKAFKSTLVRVRIFSEEIRVLLYKEELKTNIESEVRKELKSIGHGAREIFRKTLDEACEIEFKLKEIISRIKTIHISNFPELTITP